MLSSNSGSSAASIGCCRTPELRPDAAAATSSRSASSTDAPASARNAASAQPTIPAPTTATSGASVKPHPHGTAGARAQQLELQRLAAADAGGRAAPARQRPVLRLPAGSDDVVGVAQARERRGRALDDALDPEAGREPALGEVALRGVAER